jgi:hypothetical protein
MAVETMVDSMAIMNIAAMTDASINGRLEEDRCGMVTD